MEPAAPSAIVITSDGTPLPPTVNLTTRLMKTFNLPNNKTVSRDASHCVALLRGNGRWTHRWFKSLRGAENEYRFWRNCGQHVRDYNDIENVKLIKGN